MSFEYSSAIPLADAIESISDRTPIGSFLKSPDWELVPLELRQRAFFSSGVESIRLLSRMRHRIEEMTQLKRRELAAGSEGAFLDRNKFILEMQELAIQEGLQPTDPGVAGGLQDITSHKRLGLIFDIQVQQANNYAKHRMDQDPDVLDEFPAQELIRLEAREEPRDWVTRWRSQGGRMFPGGRMIALKTDPVWSRISRFGTPYPPFDFNSGMGLEDIDRDEAEELGLVEPGEVISPELSSFNDDLEASVRNLTNEELSTLEGIFGDQVEVQGDTVRWKGDA